MSKEELPEPTSEPKVLGPSPDEVARQRQQPAKQPPAKQPPAKKPPVEPPVQPPVQPTAQPIQQAFPGTSAKGRPPSAPPSRLESQLETAATSAKLVASVRQELQTCRAQLMQSQSQLAKCQDLLESKDEKLWEVQGQLADLEASIQKRKARHAVTALDAQAAPSMTTSALNPASPASACAGRKEDKEKETQRSGRCERE